MRKYIIRLDDAATKMDQDKWNRMESLLDKFGIKPLVGVIPNCHDPMMDIYDYNSEFWSKVYSWQEKGWCIALHGYEHVYNTQCGGINPINNRSEFAGLSLAEQRKKISNGLKILKSHSIEPKVFFAPSHTFDQKTIDALRIESNIRIISDTIAANTYTEYGMTFVPQQSGKVRRLPLQIVTFCYHPNFMTEDDYEDLERFLVKYNNRFDAFPTVESQRALSKWDKLLRFLYFTLRNKNLKKRRE